MSGRVRINELEDGVDRCIRHCIETGEAPVAFVLHKFVDVSDESLAEYLARGEAAMKGKAKKDVGTMRRFRAARRWEEFKTFYWLDKAQREPKNASFAMFNLKQAENGGYGEKEGKAEKVTVTLKLQGVGGEEGMK